MGHHYVPQKYLSRFADPCKPDSVWLIDKEGGEPRRVGIAGVAQSRGYYSSADEAKLAELVEAPADRAISKLVQGQTLTDDDRLRLSFYIATMMRRVPYRRRRVYETIVPPVLKELIDSKRIEVVQSAHAVSADPIAVAYQLAQVSAYEEELQVDLPEQLHAEVRKPWPTAKMVVAVYDLAWRVLETDGPIHFLTSDNPSFFFEQFGIGTEKSEITFPLSSQRCLHCSRQGPTGGLLFLVTSQAIVNETNARVASTTERTAFYHQNALWIQPLLTKAEQKLNLIKW